MQEFIQDLKESNLLSIKDSVAGAGFFTQLRLRIFDKYLPVQCISKEKMSTALAKYRVKKKGKKLL